MMLQNGGGDDAIVRFADRDSLFSKLTVDVRRFDKNRVRYRQHHQRSEVPPNAPEGCIIRNALENFCKHNPAKRKIFVIEDESF